MSKEIDWSKAPEWAKTVIRSSGNDGHLFWAEAFGTVSRRQRISGYKDTDAHGANMTIEGHMWTLVETRPMAWTGEGMPPVGVECEFKSPSSGGWSKARIVFVSGWTIVLYVFFEHDEHCYSVSAFEKGNLKFRPIRTPEQIAAEEREAACEKMLEIAKTRRPDPDVYEAIATLYDAGFRKP